jgi:peroxiredoxin
VFRGRRLLAGCLAGSSALLGVSACSGSSRPDYGLGGNGVIVPVAKRVAAPALSGPSLLSSGTVSLAQFKGKVVVLNYWGEWCAPCRAEGPGLGAAWQSLQADGAQFVGLDTRDTDSEAKRFLQSDGQTYPEIVDRTGDLQVAFAPIPIQGSPPVTVILDRSGKVATRFVGETTDSVLTQAVRTVLAGKA